MARGRDDDSDDTGDADLRQRKRELRESMNDAKREIGALLATVVDFPPEGRDAPGFEAFASWTLSELTSTEFFTAVSFEAHGGTGWRSFERDLTVAPASGAIVIEFKSASGEDTTAQQGAPVIVPARRTARYSPVNDARGVLIFIPPIIDTEDDG